MAKKALSTNKEAVVDKLAFTIAKDLQAVGQDTGFAVWPSPFFHPIESDLYAAQYLMPILYKDLLELEKKGLSNEQVARMLKAPSRIAQLTWLVSALGVADLTKEEKIDLVYRIVKLTSVFRKDPFCEDGKNILWSDAEVRQVLDKTQWAELDKTPNPHQYHNTLNQLNGLAWLFTELLYSYFHGAGHEFHGPYALSGGQILVVREFYDLRPEFWPFALKLPFDKATVLSVYDKADVRFDFFNRMETKESLGVFLRKTAVMIDENSKPLNLRGIKDVLQQFKEASAVGIEDIEKLGRTELLKKCAEGLFFIIKPLHEKLGKDWWPPKEQYESIEKEDKKEIIEGVLKEFRKMDKMSKEEFIEGVTHAFNPRLQ